MKKLFLIPFLMFISHVQVQAEPNVNSYTFLPTGATMAEGSESVTVEYLDDGEQTLTVSNTSNRENFSYDEKLVRSLPYMGSSGLRDRDSANWIGFYAAGSGERGLDYTLMRTRPDRSFTATNLDQVNAKGFSQVQKLFRYKITGHGHVKIKIPFHMLTNETGVLAHENWDGEGRYINKLSGTLNQVAGNPRTEIDNAFVEQQTTHERTFNPELGKYKVNVFTQYLTNDGIDLPEETNTHELKSHKQGVFILEGHVSDGIIEVELTLKTAATLDYSITTN